MYILNNDDNLIVKLPFFFYYVGLTGKLLDKYNSLFYYKAIKCTVRQKVG